MKVIVGLGNPGSSYKNTRHNLGFMVLDKLAKEYKAKFKKDSRLKGHKAVVDNLLLVKPYVFMNLSGVTVRKIKDKFSLKFEDILVICDDLNLPLGKIRIKPKGSSGGHKGLGSIIESIQGQDFPRLRIGVGSPQINEDASSFVLSRFSKEELPEVKNSLVLSTECAIGWTKEDVQDVMAKFN